MHDNEEGRRVTKAKTSDSITCGMEHPLVRPLLGQSFHEYANQSRPLARTHLGFRPFLTTSSRPRGTSAYSALDVIRSEDAEPRSS